MYIVVGLGNPGDEYEKTRHNTGRIVVDYFAKKEGFLDWEFDKRINASVTQGKVGREKVELMKPEGFMNNSGKSVKGRVKTKKAAAQCIVVYDDIDLPIGLVRIAFNRGTGGHNGLRSIERALGTKEFIRVRVGVSPVSAKGVARKPKGEEKVLKFLLGNFTKSELEKMRTIKKKAHEAVAAIITEGRERAMNEYN